MLFFYGGRDVLGLCVHRIQFDCEQCRAAEDARLDESMSWYPEDDLDMRDPDAAIAAMPLCPRCYWRPPLRQDWCAHNDGDVSG